MADERITKIKLDEEFTLCVDPWNYWIMQKTVVGNGNRGKQARPENIGKVNEVRYGGYYTTFTDCMKNFVRKQPQFAEVKSISALMKCEKDGQEKVSEWCKELDSAFRIIQKNKQFAPLLKELGTIMAENSKK